jgi:hypothetical protein
VVSKAAGLTWQCRLRAAGLAWQHGRQDGRQGSRVGVIWGFKRALIISGVLN